MGINLAAVGWYSRQLAFGNLVKQSWRKIAIPEGLAGWEVNYTSTPPTIDADGWPTDFGDGDQAFTFLHNSNGGEYPSGTYHVSYQDCHIRMEGDGDFVDRTTPGTDFTFNVVSPGNNGIWLRLISITGSAPRVTVFHEDDRRAVFSRRFARRLAQTGYRCIRFMDWGGTNFSTQQNWADRPTLTARAFTSENSFGKGGVPWELMIRLANMLDAQAWVCVPHLATDDYVAELGALIASEAPRHPVIVEYSNECWNSATFGGGTGQAQYVIDQQGSGDGMTFYAQRSQQIWNTLEAILGRNGIVRAVNVNVGNTGNTTTVLADCEPEMIAVAPYVGNGFDPSPADLDTVFEMLRYTGTGAPNENFSVMGAQGLAYFMDQHLALMGPNQVLGAYEGGQHLAGATHATLFGNAQTDARMGDVYRQLFQEWGSRRQTGPFCAFADFFPGVGSSAGHWGLQNTYTADHATDRSTYPKLDAVAEYAAAWRS